MDFTQEEEGYYLLFFPFFFDARPSIEVDRFEEVSPSSLLWTFRLNKVAFFSADCAF